MLSTNAMISSFLIRRGFTFDDFSYLQQPQETHTHDPFLLQGVDLWITLLHQHKGESIAIIPDYDMDGVSSGTLARVSLYLFGFGDCFLYYPRVSDGYGLTRTSIDRVLAQRPDTTVIITTDNGSNAYDGIAYAKSLGLTVLVTDHHLSDDLPVADAVVNPNGHGDTTYPFSSICGATVIYKVMLAYAMKYNVDVVAMSHFKSLILLVGMASVSDVMPMLDENRYYVTKAVSMLQHYYKGHTVERFLSFGDSPIEQFYRGIDLLLFTMHKQGKLKYGITDTTFGFMIGPMLNSPRRMQGTSELSFSLFTTLRSDMYDSNQSHPSDLLYTLNEERKMYVRYLSGELFTYMNAEHRHVIDHMVFNAVMFSGVAGLLSSAFSNTYHLPSIAFSVQVSDSTRSALSPINVPVVGNYLLSGSARAPSSFNLHALLASIDHDYPDLIYSWGGHAEAAGIKIHSSNYDAFCSVFKARVLLTVETLTLAQNDCSTASLLPSLPYHVEYMIDTLTRQRLGHAYDASDYLLVSSDDPSLHEGVSLLSTVAPFGQGFTSPSFGMMLSTLDIVNFFPMGAEKTHIKLILRNGFSVIYWNGFSTLSALLSEVETCVFMIKGQVSINNYQGHESLQFVMSDYSIL